jgi:hypothetical protein
MRTSGFGSVSAAINSTSPFLVHGCRHVYNCCIHEEYGVRQGAINYFPEECVIE